jgi:glycosyltransferase involved in cell wall biosynthesis
MIGIAITTFNRRAMFEATLRRILALAPADAPIVVVDDGSTEPVAVPERVTLYRFDSNQGIAAAKNKCLELLCETRANDFFLFDDDTWPTAPGWWLPYVESDQPHLMYQFASSPGHWAIDEVGGDPHHRAFDKPRGCMLYVRRGVLRVVGGLHTAFGKHGAEHGNWSDRIFAAGLTRWPYADVRAPALHCRDQDEAGISSVDYREHQQWRNVDASALAVYAPFRRPIPVLVPRRADHGERDALWRHVRQLYWDAMPGFTVVEGAHEEGPFNRSAAVNAAAAAAGDWELAVIADSDSWVGRLQLRDAIALARRTGRMVAAFDQVCELAAPTTRRLLEERALSLEDGWATEKVRTEQQDPTTVQSTMLVVPRRVWDAVGGFDEGFIGWGCEDNAFWRSVELIAGAPLRVPGPAWHLWHSPGRPASRHEPHYVGNLRRWGRYAAARTPEDIAWIRDRVPA